MSEEWREIEEAQKYLVSNEGRVKKKNTDHIIKIRKSTHDQDYVNIELNNGKFSTRAVHKFVSKAFPKREETE